jgi:SH3-like domain-containing protein
VTSVRPFQTRSLALALGLIALWSLYGCGGGRERVLEVVYISAPQVTLRDRVAPVYNKLGTIPNGERVEVLDRDRRFIKVRTGRGEEGWIEQRYTIGQKTYDALQKLTQDSAAYPVQGTATTRNDANIHLEPERESEHLYQIPAGSKISILKRTASERQLPGAKAKDDAAKAVMEDWWLARDAAGHTGWILCRMVDLNVPLDVAQYAEGQRIQALFVLDEVSDGDKKVPQYLMLLSEPKDGMPFDYNQMRVFTWNVKRHRYETAYRERKLEGFFPVSVGHENFDKEGDLPVFVLKVKDSAGNLVDRKYKLNTPIVRRVLAPGEVPEKPAGRSRPRSKRSGASDR